MNENLGALKSFVHAEIKNGATDAQMIETQQMLQKDFSTLSLKLAFLVNCGQPIFDLIHDVQVPVAPTWRTSGAPVRPRMHRVYNQLLKLHDALEDRTTHGNLVDQVLEALSDIQRAPYRQGFNVALTAAANKVSKYLQLLPFATSAESWILGSMLS